MKITYQDEAKVKARAERFGTQTKSATGQKRAAEVDPEEAARRQKRAERFGLVSASSWSVIFAP